ncbi:MAG: prepilin-type N-terminal cleavage/methylation domain-containing protein, partial [Blastocatellia bacterium]|nr:prepilin-type N-terminal cleavage/methylation domain-containing protein [Blastocatellia bacterium]
RRNQGFTLLELLIITAILLIIGASVVSAVITIARSQRATARQLEANTLAVTVANRLAVQHLTGTKTGLVVVRDGEILLDVPAESDPSLPYMAYAQMDDAGVTTVSVTVHDDREKQDTEAVASY